MTCRIKKMSMSNGGIRPEDGRRLHDQATEKSSQADADRPVAPFITIADVKQSGERHHVVDEVLLPKM